MELLRLRSPPNEVAHQSPRDSAEDFGVTGVTGHFVKTAASLVVPSFLPQSVVYLGLRAPSPAVGKAAAEVVAAAPAPRWAAAAPVRLQVLSCPAGLPAVGSSG